MTKITKVTVGITKRTKITGKYHQYHQYDRLFWSCHFGCFLGNLHHKYYRVARPFFTPGPSSQNLVVVNPFVCSGGQALVRVVLPCTEWGRAVIWKVFPVVMSWCVSFFAIMSG